MKTSKKLLSVLLSALLLVSCMVTAFAVSGTDGNITWTYDEATKTLTISGTGAMPDYDEIYPAWEDYSEDIVHIVIEDGVTSIGEYAFAHCDALKSVTIPGNVTSIGDGAFADCTALSSVTIPDSVTSIGEYAFEDCDALRLVTIPDSVTRIGDGAFAFCDALRSVTLSNSVTRIGEGTFYSCVSLTSMTISDSVTSIGFAAFAYCYALESVTIPSSVTEIGEGAFYHNTAMKTVNYTGSEADWNNIQMGEDAFNTEDSEAVIYPLEFTINYNYGQSQPDTPDIPDTPDTPADNGAACPVCGQTTHDPEWLGILHGVFYALKFLVNEVLIPLVNLFR